jgi:hypothetical protein
MSLTYVHKRRVMKSEIFVCDNCGTRTRLNSAERHWCDLCIHGPPLEMRPARDKRISNIIAPLVSPIPAVSLVPRPQSPRAPESLFGHQPTYSG